MECSFDDCTRPAGYLGLCKGHQRQKRTSGRLTPFVDRVRRDPICTFEGCGRPHNARGLCAAHFSQMSRGDVLYPVGDQAVHSAKKKAAWARLSDDEKAARIAPALANLNKRNKHWRDANAAAQRKVWVEGRGGPKKTRFCLTCGGEFLPSAGPQVYCSHACILINRRAMNHGMNAADLHALESRHDGCAICGRVTKLVIDHDHGTKKVRGLLCSTCNTGLGKLGDSADNLRRAIAYLER